MLESELKLTVAQENLAKVSRIACVRDALLSPLQRRLVRNLYYDTPDFDLWKAGIELRVRRVGGKWIQTIKAPGPALIGLQRRIEIESPMRGATPDLTALASTELPSAVDSPVVRGRIEKVFETRYWRRRGMLRLPDGSLIEVNVDSGDARAGDESLPISEVELELKHGDAGVLYATAERLADSIDVRINPLRKPVFGYRILREFQSTAVFAKKTELLPGQSAEDVFASLLSESLEHAFANEEVILDGSDIEGVHQMRVGLRRFRSCLSVFKRVMPTRISRWAEDAVKPLLKSLGPARDWDVFLGEDFAQIERAVSRRSDLSEIRNIAEEHKNRVYHDLRSLLRSREFHRGKLGLFSWIARHAWREAMTPVEIENLTRPADGYMQWALQRGDRRVRRQARAIKKQSAKDLHQLRITVKKQRYSAEFFEGRFPEKRARGYAEALKDLQNELGRLHNGATAASLLKEIGKTPGARRAVAFVRKRAKCEHAKAIKQLSGCWKQFKRQKSFWK